MGAFVISDSKSKAEKALNWLLAAGFHNYNEINKDTYFLRVHKKRNINNENIMLFDNDNFIAINGTCIYNNKIGNLMLRELYEQFSGDIEYLRKKLIGHYVVIIKKGGLIYLACDKHELFKVFYHRDGTNFIFSTLFEAVVETLEKKIIRKYLLYQTLFSGCMIGPDTIYKGVNRLLGNDLFIIDTASGKIKRDKINNNRTHYDLQNKSIKECVDFYTEEVKNVFSSISNAFGPNINIEMTGGLDTRTVLAGLNNVEGYADLSYGCSSNSLVNQKDEDLSVVKELAKLYKRNVYLMNWEDDGRIDECTFDEYFRKYGFDYVTYGCSRNYFQEYEKKIKCTPQLLMNGYLGETIKGREWLNYRWEDPINISKVIYKYFIYHWINDNLIRDKNEWKEFRIYLASQLLHHQKITYNMNIKNGRIYKNDFNEFRWVASRGDSAVTNFHNQFTYCMSPLGDTLLFDKALEIPYKYRKHNIFQFEVIKALDRSLIDVPLFSHCHFREIKNGELLKEKLVFQQLVSQYMTKAYRELYLYRKKYKHRNDHMIHGLQKYLKEHSFLTEYINIDKLFNPILLSYIVLYTFGINKLGMDAIE